MSVDKAFREMVRNEIEAQLKPLRDLVSRLEAGTADLDRLRTVAEQLAPLAGAVGPLFGVAAGSRGAAAAPVRRGPGRPARAASAPAPVSGGKKRGRKPAAEGGSRECAIRGCGKPSRTKGYCAAHYQKLRMLEKTNRRPTNWVDYAESNSVEDIKLPRGRAAAKALAEAKNAG
ncbi:cell wall protein [Archangium lansingense]|uniref:Cell wall protein n=1 Tax=Archangium lansingense TaxID=2995310 RepID=A0ABT4ANA9_9BACT|nr:cell wall protein [Archangium lansinium]MCY1083165.1 cell wall protein [Archangium lansinium]